MVKGSKRKRTWLVVLVVVAVLLALGAWSGDRMLKGRGHPGLGRFIRQWTSNYPKSFAVEPPMLAITVEQAELDKLQQVVDAARERGVIMPEGNDYVPGELEGDAGRFKAKLRIKGKMTDHVKGDKWSFRVIAKKDGGFLGMRRFSLQHPGTRNYLCEWLHQRLMQGEGVIALRYGFMKLRFNEEDLGVYAYEEHFGPELLEHNGRVQGPLFRFDPGLFWEHRLNELRKLRLEEAYAAYQAAALDAFDSGDLDKDDKARGQFEEALGLMSAFRSGELKAAEVFDADRVARRLAMLDLLGGHRSLDWSDVKFYYDPVLRRVEPVAYESFSAHPIRALAGSGQWQGGSRPDQDLHTAWFSDEAIFRAYVRHLERFSRQSYLDSAFQALGPALDTASATVYGEFPYKELDRSIYYANQRVIRRTLDVPKGFHAYRQEFRGDTLVIVAVPVESLPIEVHGLVGKEGALLAPLGTRIVPVRPARTPGMPIELRFLVSDTVQHQRTTPLKLAYGVLGASQRKELEVFPYALLDGVALSRYAVGKASADMRNFPFITVDEATRTVVLRPGSWTLDQDLVIPTGYTVLGVAPLRVDLLKGARFVSRSPVTLRGLPDAPVVFTSSDKSGGGVLLAGTGGTSVWEHVRMDGFGPSKEGASIVFQDAPAELTACVFGEDRSRDLLLLVRGKVRFTGGTLVGGQDQLTCAFTEVRTDGLRCLGAGDDGVVVRGATLAWTGGEISGTQGIGVKVNAQGRTTFKSMMVDAKGKGIELDEGSTADLEQCTVKAGTIGIDLRPLKMRYGPNDARVDGGEVQGTEASLRNGKGNTLQHNGKAVEAAASAK